jgi:two-component system nitrogen regulation response regulator GlnG
MLQRLNKKHSTGTTEISKDAIETLKRYNWPGNVRELENILHSASVVSKGKRILLKDLPDTLTEATESVLAKQKPGNISGSISKLITETIDSTEDGEKKLTSEKRDHFGTSHTADDKSASLETPPSSISLKESYDIAYAHSRKLTDSNLLELVEKEIIQRTLTECGGNQVKASALLGITRATLRKRIDTYEIRY